MKVQKVTDVLTNLIVATVLAFVQNPVLHLSTKVLVKFPENVLVHPSVDGIAELLLVIGQVKFKN
jgi:hypothetical protein